MSRLVQRLGRTGFAGLTSLAWALPLAAWAGSVDLYPGPAPWFAFGAGLIVLGAWLLLLRWAGTVPVTPRPSRLDIRAMSAGERAWNAAFAACAIGVIGWLNGAATVDWRLLGGALAAGRPGATGLAIALALLLCALVAGAAVSWRRSSAEFGARRRR